MLARERKNKIINDLRSKMVFLVGPRQVGKTWLAKEISSNYKSPVYLNYDSVADRERILKADWLGSTDLIVLDEIHKMPEWKNHIKGIFDTKKPDQQILITGSARLDILRESGDSLAGRFLRHCISPVTLAELELTGENRFDIDTLIHRGGFPEPLLVPDDIAVNRWRQTYVDVLLRDDILDFETIRDFQALKLTFYLLRQQVGSTISYASLSRDVGVAPATITKYIQTLESLFIIFRTAPYATNIARSLLKEPKVYFYDNGLVQGDDGARFENFTALSLLAHVNALRDLRGEDWELKYLRTKDQQEVDFALVKDNSIQRIVEAKLSNEAIDQGLLFFSQKYNLPATQIVKNLKHERQSGSIQVLRAESFLRGLGRFLLE